MALEKNVTPDGTVVESHKFTLSEVGDNHNKFWNVRLYDSNDVFVEWGRVGVTKSNGTHRCAGSHKMNSLIRSKGKKGYKENQVLDGDFDKVSSGSSVNNVDLKKLAQEQIEHSSPETAKLIMWFAEVNRHNITGATDGRITFNADKGLFQTEQGIVTPDTVKEARALLVKIGDSIAKNDFDSVKVKKNVGEYLMYIPQNVGMKLRVDSFLPDLQAVQKQGQILDALDASYISATAVHTDDKTKKDDTPKSKIFETKLTLVDDKDVIDRINKFYMGSRNQSHYQVYNLMVKKVWAVEIKMMEEAFEKMGKKVGNVCELWHGTQPSSCLSILKVGLIIPPASSPHVTGRLYNDGVYASSQSTKALNYATSFWGQKDWNRYFMFLLDMAMGKPYLPNRNNYMRVKYPVPGYDSTWAKSGSGVMNDERIVYQTSQVNIKYLIEFGK